MASDGGGGGGGGDGAAEGKWKVNDTVDAFDKIASQWFVATILEVGETEVKVRWSGFSHLSDRWISVTHVAPFGTHMDDSKASLIYKQMVGEGGGADFVPPPLPSSQPAAKKQKTDSVRTFTYNVSPNCMWRSHDFSSGQQRFYDDTGAVWYTGEIDHYLGVRLRSAVPVVSIFGLVLVYDHSSRIIPYDNAIGVTNPIRDFTRVKAIGTVYCSCEVSSVQENKKDASDRAADTISNLLWLEFSKQSSPTLDFVIHLAPQPAPASSSASAAMEDVKEIEPTSLKFHSAILAVQSDVIRAQLNNSMGADAKTTHSITSDDPALTIGALRLFGSMLYGVFDSSKGTCAERLAADRLWSFLCISSQPDHPFCRDIEKQLSANDIAAAADYADLTQSKPLTEAVHSWIAKHPAETAKAMRSKKRPLEL